VAVPQTRCFEAGVQFARAEGIVPAPESTHAIRAAVDEAIRCREEGQSRAILFGLSGHGHFDMVAYDKFLAGTLEDDALDDEMLTRAAASIPRLASV